MNKTVNNWINCPTSKENNPKYRLICFPHAGGSASFFRSWETQLKGFEVCPVSYPGRAERIQEPLPTDLRQLAQDIAQALLSFTDLPLVFFGHSMGAPIALETARAIEKNNIYISHLFASGSRNGPCPVQKNYVEEDNENLCKNLIDMGGTNPDAISDPIFHELVMPAIKADGKMFHNYKMEKEPILNCPITTIYGDVDIHADIRPWQKLTTNQFNEICTTGGHFYLISEPPFKSIKDGLNELNNKSKEHAKERSKHA